MMDIIADVTETAVINTSVSRIDLTGWLFTLKDNEYQACSKAHIAAGSTFSEDGKRMSLNVEQIADNLLIQHYVEEIGQKNHCRVHSFSDSLSPAGRTKLSITWELKIESLSEVSCELSNRVVVRFTEDFLNLLQHAGVTDLELVKSGMTANVSMHNKEETPLFAKDIENKALAGMWNRPVGN